MPSQFPPTLTIEQQKHILCLECQLCCKELHFQIPIPPTLEDTKKTYAFFQARGVRLGIVAKKYLFAIVPSTCPHLTTDGCDIYLTRPEACRVYSGLTDPILSDRCLWREL